MIPNSQKQLKCPSNDERINNMSYVPTVEYYLTQGVEALTHATGQMDLENMLRERSWAQKTTPCVILFIYNVQIRQIHRDLKVD